MNEDITVWRKYKIISERHSKGDDLEEWENDKEQFRRRSKDKEYNAGKMNKILTHLSLSISIALHEKTHFFNKWRQLGQ